MNSDSISRYLKDMGNISLLSAKDECLLSDIKNNPKLSEDERNDAIKTLVKHNLRFVITVAKQFGTDFDFDDIVFDGNQGLVIAAQKFNAKKGRGGKGRFTTYAMYWILKYIKEGFRKRNFMLVSIPKKVMIAVRKIAEDGTLPKNSDINTIAETLGLSKYMAEGVKTASEIVIVSTDHLTVDGDKIIEIPDTNTLSPYAAMERVDKMNIVKRAFDALGLCEDDRNLILHAATDRTGSEYVIWLAKKRGVTTSRIRMLKKELLWRLRRKIIVMIGKVEFASMSNKIVPNDWRKLTLDRIVTPRQAKRGKKGSATLCRDQQSRRC